jgi:hypothetical protein
MIYKLNVELFIFTSQFKLPFHEWTSCPIFVLVDDQIRGVTKARDFKCFPDERCVARALEALVVDFDATVWRLVNFSAFCPCFFVNTVKVRHLTVLFVLSLNAAFNLHGLLKIIYRLEHLLEILSDHIDALLVKSVWNNWWLDLLAKVPFLFVHAFKTRV